MSHREILVVNIIYKEIYIYIYYIYLLLFIYKINMKKFGDQRKAGENVTF